MLFQHKDGVLHIIEHGVSGTTYYVKILFTDANLSGPISRAQTEERLVLDRGVLSSDGHYVESDDTARLEPLPLTFSCRSADTSHSQVLLQLLSGATNLSLPSSGQSWTMHSRKGKGISIYGLATSLPDFKDQSFKAAYMVEVLYSGTSNWGFRWDEVYFPPAEQTVAEAEDSLTLNLNGQIFGGVTKITAFTSGTEIPS